MGPTPITSSIKTATPCGWLFLWLLVEGSRRADQKKPQWGFFPPPGSASQRLRSPQGKQPAACAETPITSTQCGGRESEPRQKTVRWTVFRGMGSVGKRERQPIRPAPCRLWVDSHHQHVHKFLRFEIPRQARDDKEGACTPTTQKRHPRTNPSENACGMRDMWVCDYSPVLVL